MLALREAPKRDFESAASAWPQPHGLTGGVHGKMPQSPKRPTSPLPRAFLGPKTRKPTPPQPTAKPTARPPQALRMQEPPTPSFRNFHVTL